MPTDRSSGILLHPTSLSSRFGIGDLGGEAERFIDWLVDAGQRFWQMLPLGPCDEGGSPYQSFSSSAGNPLLISPERLADDGLLDADELDAAATEVLADDGRRVDYRQVSVLKERLLRAAAARFDALEADHPLRRECDEFCRQNAAWLDDFACFLALREANDRRPWLDWTEGVDTRRRLDPAASESLQPAIDFHRFVQFIFARQWSRLRRYAHRAGVWLIGDLPIYVSADSADVWAHRELFELDDRGRPSLVAGVPPDYFSSTGQLWNNPLYDWDANRRQGYRWWIDRVRTVLSRVDVVRLDHFRGFEAYWAVPAGEADARNGQWLAGPGKELFDAISAGLSEQRPAIPAARCLFSPLPFIAENLGHITRDVDALQHAIGLPGMVVLQFALLGQIEGQFDPGHIDPKTVIYTGTHDNNTSRGWFDEEVADDIEKIERLRQFIAEPKSQAIAAELIHLAWHSSAALAVAPLQDVLNLPAEARMNRPGTDRHVAPNWTWRLDPRQLTVERAEWLRDMSSAADRG